MVWKKNAAIRWKSSLRLFSTIGYVYAIPRITYTHNFAHTFLWDARRNRREVVLFDFIVSLISWCNYILIAHCDSAVWTIFYYYYYSFSVIERMESPLFRVWLAKQWVVIIMMSCCIAQQCIKMYRSGRDLVSNGVFTKILKWIDYKRFHETRKKYH